MKYIINNSKNIFIGLILGCVLTTFLFMLTKNNSIKEITFLPNFEIQDNIQNYLYISGVYKDIYENIHISELECFLEKNICIDSPITLTKDGILVPIGTKEFKIIEKTPTRIVSKFTSSAQFHIYVIDLATKKVIFKSEDHNRNPSSVDLYELTHGTNILK